MTGERQREESIREQSASMWCLEGVATVRVQASPWGAVEDEAGLARAFQLYPGGLQEEEGCGHRLENAHGGGMGTLMTTGWEAGNSSEVASVHGCCDTFHNKKQHNLPTSVPISHLFVSFLKFLLTYSCQCLFRLIRLWSL